MIDLIKKKGSSTLFRSLFEMEEIHPLQSKYTFWVQVSGKGKSEAEFSQKIINLCTCESVEDFWECWINTPQPMYK